VRRTAGRIYLIRNAFPKDAGRLTVIAVTAKRYWNYPDSHMERFRPELTVSADYILSPDTVVRCEEIDGAVIAFYAVVRLHEPRRSGTVVMEDGFWLEHMFVLPACHRKGIGTRLFEDMKAELARLKADRVRIFVDPHAKDFYKKMGASLVRYSDSSIPGRKIPVYEYRIRSPF
jgi:GNAT superfamily N-acetyltransferase